MEDPVSHTHHGRYPPSPPNSSPTEVASPVSFDKPYHIPSPSDAKDSNKMLLFTMFQLLQRIEAQVEGQESRLKGVESSMSLRTRYLGSQSPSQKIIWGNVVEEYERSILNLRKSFVEVDEKREGDGTSENHGRSGEPDYLHVGNQDEDTYSVSVYSANYLERTLEHGHSEDTNPSANESIPSIRYNTDRVPNIGTPTQEPFQIPWEQSSKSRSRSISQRSHQYLEVATTVLGTWKVSVISEFAIMKNDIRKSSRTSDSEVSEAGREDPTTPRPPRPLYKFIGRTYCIIDNSSTRITLKAKKEWKIRKENSVSMTRRFGHFSKANLKHARQTLSTFKEGFVAY